MHFLDFHWKPFKSYEDETIYSDERITSNMRALFCEFQFLSVY